jgi:hypothetical protein
MTKSAWEDLAETIAAAPYPSQALPIDPSRAQGCLATLGITTRSWLGAVVANAGGLLVDHGWLRVLGSGAQGLPDVLSYADPAMGGLVVALDVLGGQFAWVPAKPGKRPTIHYFGPDLLEWQDLEQGYADWLYHVLNGSLTSFYETLRWPEWEAEVAGLGLDQGIYAYPPPWSVQGKDLSNSTRKPVPMGELVAFHHDTAKWINSGTEGK